MLQIIYAQERRIAASFILYCRDYTRSPPSVTQHAFFNFFCCCFCTTASITENRLKGVRAYGVRSKRRSIILLFCVGHRPTTATQTHGHTVAHVHLTRDDSFSAAPAQLSRTPTTDHPSHSTQIQSKVDPPAYIMESCCFGVFCSVVSVQVPSKTEWMETWKNGVDS